MRIIIFFSFYLTLTSAYSQDLLLTKSNDSLNVKVYESTYNNFLFKVSFQADSIKDRINKLKTKTLIKDYYLNYNDRLILESGKSYRADQNKICIKVGDTISQYLIDKSLIGRLDKDYYSDNKFAQSHYLYFQDLFEDYELRKALKQEKTDKFDLEEGSSNALIQMFSQETTFGKVSAQELALTHCPYDSSASAVVLFDKGVYTSNVDPVIGAAYRGSFPEDKSNFSRHLRIKILNKSGLKWANWKFSTGTAARFKAITYNLVNDLVVLEKFNNKDIYDERIIDNYSESKIFIPNVKVGTIIDIEYYFSGMPTRWFFQFDIPTLFSELKIDRSIYRKYSFKLSGFVPVQTISANEHWVALNVPSFSGENFINDPINYISKMEIELESVSNYTVTETWQDVNRILWDYYEEDISNKEIRQFIKRIKDQNLGEEAVIDSTFFFVKNNFRFNGVNSVVPGNRGFAEKVSSQVPLEDPVNSATMNQTMISILRVLGVEVGFVALSTRNNGLINPISPSLMKFNHLIGLYTSGSKILFLDTTDPYSIPGYLPEKCINNQGRLITSVNLMTEWIDLKPTNSLEIQSMLNLDIGTATATGTIQRKLKGYAYSNLMDSYEELENSEEAYSSKVAEKESIEIRDYQLKKVEKRNVASENMDIDLNNIVNRFGNEIFFNPILLLDERENLFKSPTRQYPVDLTFPLKKTMIISIKLDSSIEVISLPEQAYYTLEGNKGSFKYFSNYANDQIQMQIQFALKETQYTEKEYLGLRDFYIKVGDKLTEEIVLNLK